MKEEKIGEREKISRETASKHNGLEDGLWVGLGGLKDLVGEPGNEREEGTIFVGVEGLDKDEQGA